MSGELDVQSDERNPFHLQPGMAVEVMTPENRLIFAGAVNTIFDGAVSIREANNNTLPMALTNKPLKLRFFRAEDNLVLKGKVCGSTMKLWKVNQLESAFVQEQRAFFRQRTSLNLGAQCGKWPKVGDPLGPSFPCQVLDISAGGMLISSQAEFKVDDCIYINGVALVPNEPPFDFNCQVRRSGAWKKDYTHYGCQFLSLPPKEQDRLLQAIFVVQREDIRRQKGR